AGAMRPAARETFSVFWPPHENAKGGARLDQPTGHVEAPLSEPNEADIHRRPSLDAPFWSVANLPRTPGCSHVRGELGPWTPLEQLEMPVPSAHHAARRRAGGGKIGVQEFAAHCAASKRGLTVEAPMPSKPDPAEMPRLDAFDEEFGQDPAAILRGQRRKTRLRLLTLLGVVVGAGVIGALALAWSTADGRLRPELQSAATSPRNA